MEGKPYQGTNQSDAVKDYLIESVWKRPYIKEAHKKTHEESKIAK